MGGAISCCEPGSSKAYLLSAMTGDVEQLDACLRSDPTLLLHKGIGGLRDTAWHLAAAEGRTESLECLFKHLEEQKEVIVEQLKSDRSVPRPASPASSPMPLHQQQQASAIKHTVNLLNVKGQTPLMFACFAGHADCVKILMNYGANPWIADHCGNRTALHYAALKGHPDCVTALLDNCPPELMERVNASGSITRLVNIPTMAGFTPLHYAAHARSVPAMESLMERGATLVAMTTADGVYDVVIAPRWTTPLHICAILGDSEGAKEILRFYMASRESGAFRDPRLSADSASRMPYHVAMLRGYTALADMMHPMRTLESIFGDGTQLERVGVPTLSILAARVLQQRMLAMVDVADSKISTLPPLDLGSPRMSRNMGSIPKDLASLNLRVNSQTRASAGTNGQGGNSTLATVSGGSAGVGGGGGGPAGSGREPGGPNLRGAANALGLPLLPVVESNAGEIEPLSNRGDAVNGAAGAGGAGGGVATGGGGGGGGGPPAPEREDSKAGCRGASPERPGGSAAEAAAAGSNNANGDPATLADVASLRGGSGTSSCSRPAGHSGELPLPRLSRLAGGSPTASLTAGQQHHPHLQPHRQQQQQHNQHNQHNQQRVSAAAVLVRPSPTPPLRAHASQPALPQSGSLQSLHHHPQSTRPSDSGATSGRPTTPPAAAPHQQQQGQRGHAAPAKVLSPFGAVAGTPLVPGGGGAAGGGGGAQLVVARSVRRTSATTTTIGAGAAAAGGAMALDGAGTAPDWWAARPATAGGRRGVRRVGGRARHDHRRADAAGPHGRAAAAVHDGAAHQHGPAAHGAWRAAAGRVGAADRDGGRGAVRDAAGRRLSRAARRVPARLACGRRGAGPGAGPGALEQGGQRGAGAQDDERLALQRHELGHQRHGGSPAIRHNVPALPRRHLHAGAGALPAPGLRAVRAAGSDAGPRQATRLPNLQTEHQSGLRAARRARPGAGAGHAPGVTQGAGAAQASSWAVDWDVIRIVHNM